MNLVLRTNRLLVSHNYSGNQQATPDQLRGLDPQDLAKNIMASKQSVWRVSQPTVMQRAIIISSDAIANIVMAN